MTKIHRHKYLYRMYPVFTVYCFDLLTTKSDLMALLVSAMHAVLLLLLVLTTNKLSVIMVKEKICSAS